MRHHVPQARVECRTFNQQSLDWRLW